MFNTSRILVAVAVITSVFFSAAADAQVRDITISGVPSCVDCTLSVARIAVLGRVTDSVLPGIMSAPVRDSRRRFYLHSADGFRIIVFDSTGRLINVLGRRGDGPGELSRITHVDVSAGDSLFVREGSVLSVFSPAFQWVRTTRLPTGSIWAATPLSNGQLLLAASLAGPASWRSLFHITNARGEVQRSFGQAEPVDSTCMTCLARSPRLEGTQTFWSAQPYRYVVEGWRTNGSPSVKITVRNSPWFDPAIAGPPRTPAERPGPRVVVAAPFGPGRVIVFGQRAAESWQPNINENQVAARVGGRAAVVRPAHDAEANREALRGRDTYIDVLDLNRRAIVASIRLREQLLSPLDGNLAYSKRIDDDGFVFFDIWRVTLPSGRHEQRH